MSKKLIVSIIILSTLVALIACNQTIHYSDHFDSIPLYPNLKLTKSSDYEEYYELSQFEDSFEEVKTFYMDNIDSDSWKIKENPLYPDQKNADFQGQGYILEGMQGDVSLIVELLDTRERGHVLYVKLNGNPFEEGKYHLRGESQHWQASLEYLLRKDGVIAQGDIIYRGDNPPEEVDYSFLVYEIKTTTSSNTDLISQSKMHENQGRQIEDSKLSIYSQSKREHDLELYKAGISQSYIEIHWKEKDTMISEKISFELIE